MTHRVLMFSYHFAEIHFGAGKTEQAGQPSRVFAAACVADKAMVKCALRMLFMPPTLMLCGFRQIILQKRTCQR